MEFYEKRINRTNRFFLLVVVLYIAFSFGIGFLLENAFIQSFLGESFLFLLGVIFLIWCKADWKEYLRLRKMDFITILFSILYTFCLMPIVAVINGLSMIFVENKAATSLSSMVGNGFWASLFVIAIMPGIVEEFLFRGIIYRGYRQARPIRGMLYSAFLFGALHMNFNQFCYAFFLGIALALLAEVTDNLFPGILVHAIFNGQSVCLLYLVQILEKFMMRAGSSEMSTVMEEAANITVESLIVTVLFYLPFAALGGVLAFFLLRALAKRNHRYEYIKTWFQKEERESLPKPRIITVSFVLGVIVCLGMCIFQELG